MPSGGQQDQDVLRTAEDLRTMVQQLSIEEFYWQEAHYDHDSGSGRELLFLIANHEWVRATSEMVEVSHSDAIETAIKIDIDSSQITHEAFRGRTGRVWLPIAVLPPQVAPRQLEPDPFATVTDAAGNLLPLLPAAELRHQVSAALAEIIVNMAVAHLPDTTDESAEADRDDNRLAKARVATRDQRLVLSAAIYRMLVRGSSQDSGSANGGPVRRTPRMNRAIESLLTLMQVYIDYLGQRAKGIPQTDQFAPELAYRAIVVLRALDKSIIVVVPVEYNTAASTVLTVKVPSRTLKRSVESAFKLWRPKTWLIRPSGHLQIDVLMATADADRQIQIQLSDGMSIDEPPDPAKAAADEPPDPATTAADEPPDPAKAPAGKPPDPATTAADEPPDPAKAPKPLPRLNITAQSLPALQELTASIEQLSCSHRLGRPHELISSLADLVGMKLAAARDALPNYEVSQRPDAPAGQEPGGPLGQEPDTPVGQEPGDTAGQEPDAPAAQEPGDVPGQERDTPAAQKPGDTANKEPLPFPDPAKMKAIRENLAQLSDALSSGGTDDVTQKALREFSDQLDKGELSLLRRTSADRLGPRTAVARAEMIEDVAQRANPCSAKVYVDVKVDDRDYVSAARSFTFMNLILIIGILGFLIGWSHANPGAPPPQPEVLAIVLTLFVAIQGSRIERPDRTTLHGLLSAVGNWFIAISTLPALTLAIAFAFKLNTNDAEAWTAGCAVIQLILQWLIWRGPLTPIKWSSFEPRPQRRIGQRRIFTTDAMDYSHFDPLRSDYWRNTTAEALMIGRPAYGYVIRQGFEPPGEASPQLESLLLGHGQGKVQPNSILALLHSSTRRQSVTFVVFRERPDHKWLPGIRKEELDLDPDRLAPMDNVTSRVDIFVGIPRTEMPTVSQHPLVTVLTAAKKKLIVLEALLPVPAPANYSDLQWARIRVALRDTNDIRRLTEFLYQIYTEVIKPEGPRRVLAVQTAPTVPPRIIGQSPAEPAEASTPPDETLGPELCAGDQDISQVTSIMDEAKAAETWRMLAICTEARSNIESEIIQDLPFEPSAFQLVHFNYALLHGMAVAIILIHRARPDARPKPAEIMPAVKFNDLVNRAALGPIEQYPLLRVRFRWQDRPGDALDVLNSVNGFLEDRQDPAASGASRAVRSVSYARFQVASGRLALGYLTIRLPDPVKALDHWDDAKAEQAARKIGLTAALAEMPDSGSAEGSPQKPEYPVIAVDLIGKDPPDKRV